MIHSKSGLIRNEHIWLWYAILLALILSGIDPQADRLTWLLETMPVMIGLIVLAMTWQRFPLTKLTYRLIALHAMILIVGGYYTYAEVPLFNYLRDSLELSRNHYDRVGHFIQGFVPAIIAREILIRRSPLRGGWLFFLTLCFCLALSAFYELIEWWVALLNNEAAEAFLGTQGDHWDTQTDMFMALIGATCSLTLLGRRHDREIARLD
jgi:putative membrane protein